MMNIHRTRLTSFWNLIRAPRRSTTTLCDFPVAWFWLKMAQSALLLFSLFMLDCHSAEAQRTKAKGNVTFYAAPNGVDCLPGGNPCTLRNDCLSPANPCTPQG